MTDFYASLPFKERIYHADPLRPRMSVGKVVLASIGIAVPGFLIGLAQILHQKSIAALLIGFVLLAVISYVIAHSLLYRFTHTNQHGVYLRRTEPVRYWCGIGFLCLIYLFICGYFIGIEKKSPNKAPQTTAITPPPSAKPLAPLSGL